MSVKCTDCFLSHFFSRCFLLCCRYITLLLHYITFTYSTPKPQQNHRPSMQYPFIITCKVNTKVAIQDSWDWSNLWGNVRLRFISLYRQEARQADCMSQTRDHNKADKKDKRKWFNFFRCFLVENWLIDLIIV